MGADGAVFVDFAPVKPVPGFSDPVSTERPKFGPGEISMGGGSGGALGPGEIFSMGGGDGGAPTLGPGEISMGGGSGGAPGEIFSMGGGDGGAPTLPLDSGIAAGEGVT